MSRSIRDYSRLNDNIVHLLYTIRSIEKNGTISICFEANDCGYVASSYVLASEDMTHAQVRGIYLAIDTIHICIYTIHI